MTGIITVGQRIADDSLMAKLTLMALQLCNYHPWHWLTYGQNATALGMVLATAVNLLAVVVLVRTLSAVNRQAQAADRQAKAAEAQVLAAQSSTAVSKAQRLATEQGAMAEREHSELIRQQTLANLRPILVFVKGVDKLGGWEYFLENHGAGVAISLKANYRGQSHQAIPLAHDILGQNHRATIALVWDIFQQEGMQVCYESQDGRSFVTTASANNYDFKQTTFEVDAKGGDLGAPNALPT